MPGLSATVMAYEYRLKKSKIKRSDYLLRNIPNLLFSKNSKEIQIPPWIRTSNA